MLARSILVLASLALGSSMAVAQPKAPAASGAPPAGQATGQAAKTGPGTQAVRAANDTIAGLLKQKAAPGSKEEKELAAKVTTSVRGFLEIDQLGKRAMVDNWQ